MNTKTTDTQKPAPLWVEFLFTLLGGRAVWTDSVPATTPARNA